MLRTHPASILALAALLAALAGTARAGGIPTNDDCSNATPVAVPSSTPGTTAAGATLDGAATCGTSVSAPGVWYSVTGTGNVLTASTCDAADFDTKISVYCGGCPSDPGEPLCVTGNDDASGCGGFTSEASWCSQAGVEYLILVHGFATATGTFTLSLSDGGVACEPITSCPAPLAIEAFCFGTAPAPCNCDNHGAPGNGCANGVYPQGANLAAPTLDPTVGPLASLNLIASGMTPLSLCILVQGSQTAGGGYGVPFGDGLLCVGGSTMRLGVRPTFLGSTRFQVMTPTDLVSLGELYYQVLYITPGMFDVCGDQGRIINSTNGLRVDWSL